MRKHSKHTGKLRIDSGTALAVFLLLCFAGGIFAGFFAQRVSAAPALEELRQYLSAYVAGASPAADARVPVWEAFFLYFRYPLAMVLLGCSLFGVAAIPLLCAAQGFSLSFAACCFAAAMGSRGVLLALTAFGVRALVTMPCMMALGCLLFPMALGFARGSKPTMSGVCGRRVTVCFFLLLAGVALEVTVVPHLFAAALAGV